MPEVKTMADKKGFIEYMNEQKSVSRWFVLRVGLLGMLAGALLAIVFSIGSFLVA
jgi:hypothetical protein